MTPNARFNEFISDITPSTTTDKQSASSHLRVRDVICSDVIRTFLGGSYKRKTAIRPATKNGDIERPDVDIYVVVTGSEWTKTPEELIDDLFSVLNKNRSELNITKIKRNRCSIAISTDKADMDISPLLEKDSTGFFRIGNRETGEWYQTEPEEHTRWSADINSQVSGRFNSLVKLIKWNRREFPTNYKHPKSIVLEVLIANNMDRQEKHFGKGVHQLFVNIVDTYAFSITIGYVPVLDDPAVSGGNLLQGVSFEAFNAFFEKTKSFRDLAQKALEAEKQEKATEYWRKIFGVRFPQTKSSSNSKGSMLQASTVVSPLAFPEVPSMPPNKPADFA